MEERAYSKYFKAFGDPTRLRILLLLSGKEMTVNEITRAIGLSQPTISRHLAILREAGAVVDDRRGQQVFYHLNKPQVGTCCSDFCCQLNIAIPSRKKKK